MEELSCNQTLYTLEIELCLASDFNINKLPSSVHSLPLEGGGGVTETCTETIETLQASVAHFHLKVYMNVIFPAHMNRLVQILPAQFNPAQLQRLAISLKYCHLEPES